MRSTDPQSLRIIDLWRFKSIKSNKTYIVEIESFSNHFFGLKFYWKGIADSKNRYSLLTNDFEPRTIVMSCIQIMLYYFANDRCASFGFVAAHDIDDSKNNKSVNKRFRFYRRMMLSLFSADKFIQVNDIRHSIYILVNRSMYDSGTIDLDKIQTEISRIYLGDYNLQIENS